MYLLGKSIYMKHISIVFIAALISLSTTAQFRNIPAPVTTAFQQKYPAATNVTWEDRVSNFQAKFIQDNVMYEARFDKKGTWQETEMNMRFDDLPEAIKSAFRSSKFSDYTIRTVAHIERNNGAREYRLFIRDNVVQRKYLYYSEDGKLLREDTKI